MKWVWEKTIQAIAACALVHRLGKAQRVLIVTPASLKTEWEEQIRRFTTLPYQLGLRPRRAPPGRLCSRAVLHPGQLRADARRLPRSERAPQARHRGAR